MQTGIMLNDKKFKPTYVICSVVTIIHIFSLDYANRPHAKWYTDKKKGSSLLTDFLSRHHLIRHNLVLLAMHAINHAAEFPWTICAHVPPDHKGSTTMFYSSLQASDNKPFTRFMPNIRPALTLNQKNSRLIWLQNVVPAANWTVDMGFSKN